MGEREGEGRGRDGRREEERGGEGRGRMTHPSTRNTDGDILLKASSYSSS